MRLHFPFSFRKRPTKCRKSKSSFGTLSPYCRWGTGCSCALGCRVQGGRVNCNCLPLCAQLTFVCGQIDQSGPKWSALCRWQTASNAACPKQKDPLSTVANPSPLCSRVESRLSSASESLESVNATEFPTQSQSERTGRKTSQEIRVVEMLF